jgi:hypothetical protein
VSTKDFWKGAGERAGKTFLQVGVATLGISATATYTGAQALGLPWETALVTATISAVLSLVTSVLNPGFTAGATEPDAPVVEGEPFQLEVSPFDTEDQSNDIVDDHVPEHAAEVIPDGEGVATN